MEDAPSKRATGADDEASRKGKTTKMCRCTIVFFAIALIEVVLYVVGTIQVRWCVVGTLTVTAASNAARPTHLHTRQAQGMQSHPEGGCEV